MNVIYWDERDTATEADRGPTDQQQQVHRTELKLQLVAEAAAERRAARERFVSQWLAERQCSGL